jgi:phosphatidylinositol glycan class U
MLSGKQIWCSVAVLRLALTYIAADSGLRFDDEVSSLPTSWSRCLEANFLWEHGLNPYENNIFAGSLVSLLFANAVDRRRIASLLFCIMDFMSAFFLKSAFGIDPLLLLLNPISFLTCVHLSFTTISNLLLCSAAFFCAKGLRMFFFLTFALAINTNILTVFFIPPFMLLSANPLQFLGSQVILATALGWLSYNFFGFHWVRKTLLDNIAFQELSPNIGPTWYFFTEMFPFFDTYSLAVFWTFIVLLLALCFLQLPPVFEHQLFISLSAIAVWSPHTSIAEFSLPLTLFLYLRASNQLR